ncbi:MAG: gp53-like domain-containing protein [Burkholderia contaminans]|uniref:gp53-like domain-containing protein n=1 Tax=Burkholderia contaminans TaxID=488447 RepID=UPI002D806DF0|nr:hypothetical protein [Burkholderia contaminans]
MAKLVESSQWEEDLYQIETSDPVEGGPDGVSNRQGKQLGGRTRYLKQQVEQSQSGLTQHVAAADPHPQYATKADVAQELGNLVGQAPETLDTINEIAQALGKDPNFATTITNQLALKAPIDSPIFTGTPKVPTPAQFDNSALAVNSAYVRSVGMQASAFTTIVGTTTLTAAAAGSTIYLGGTGNYTVTLPRASVAPAGVRIEFVSGVGVSPVTISRQGTDVIFMNANASLATVPMALGDTFTLESNGANWYAVSGSTPLAYTGGFEATLDVNGSQRLPSGYIEKWGTGTTDANGEVAVVFPKRFPAAVFSATANHSGGGAAMVVILNGTLTQDGVRFKVFSDGGLTQSGWIIHWRVLGK